MNRRMAYALFALGLVALCRPGWGAAVEGVSIDEYWSGGFGNFAVTNNVADSSLYAFAVANNTIMSTWVGETDWVTTTGYATVSRVAWEAGLNWGTTFGTPYNWTPPNTNTISWNDTFGAEYTQVAMYTTGIDLGEGVVLDAPILFGQTNDQFFFASVVAASPFVAFGADGAILGSGETTVVPLPAAVWLLGSGLLGLAVVARRSGKT